MVNNKKVIGKKYYNFGVVDITNKFDFEQSKPMLDKIFVSMQKDSANKGIKIDTLVEKIKILSDFVPFIEAK